MNRVSAIINQAEENLVIKCLLHVVLILLSESQVENFKRHRQILGVGVYDPVPGGGNLLKQSVTI